MNKQLYYNIGYCFKDYKMLEQALIHKSYDKSYNNERLEFLGDCILSMCLGEKIFSLYPNKGEGEMTSIKANMEKKDTLAIIAENIQIKSYMQVGNKVTINKTILSDAVEAVIGAIYLDSKNYNLVYRCICEWYTQFNFKYIDNYKLELATFMQKNKKKLPEYILIKSQGLDHKKVFYVSVKVNNKSFIGKGFSKKEAEKQAAKQALKALNTSYE